MRMSPTVSMGVRLSVATSGRGVGESDGLPIRWMISASNPSRATEPVASQLWSGLSGEDNSPATERAASSQLPSSSSG